MNSNTLNITVKVQDDGSVVLDKVKRKVKSVGDQGDRSFKKAGRSLGTFNAKAAKTVAVLQAVAQKMLQVVAAGTAAAAIVLTLGVYAVNAASNLQEVQSKFDVVFEGQQAKAEAWAATLVKSYAMSEREAKQYLSSVQDLLVPMGMAADQAARMSNEIVKLSADLGSFNNVPTAQVMDDIQSALVGNYETMKKYGVVLNATTVQEKAMAMGLAETKKELTAAHKAQAAYQLIIEGSKAAIGDMARTQGSYANQMKKFRSTIENIAADYGTKLLPAITKVVSWLNDKVPVAYQKVTLAGISMVDGTIKGWIHLKYTVKQITLAIKSSFAVMGDDILELWADVIVKMAKALDAISITIKNPFGNDYTIGFSSASRVMKEHAQNLRNASTASADYDRAAAKLQQSKKTELAVHKEVIKAQVDQATGYNKTAVAAEKTATATEKAAKSSEKTAESIQKIAKTADDLSLFDKEIKESNENLKKLQQTAKKLEEIEFQLMPDGLEKKVAAVNREYDALAKTIKDLQPTSERSAAEIEALLKKVESARADKIAAIREEIAKTTDDLSLFDKEIKESNENLKKLQETAKKLEEIEFQLMPDGLEKKIAAVNREYDALAKTIKNLQPTSERSAAEIEALLKKVESARADKIAAIRKEVEDTGKAAEEAQKEISKLGKLAIDVGRSISTNFSSTLSSAIQDLFAGKLKSFSDYAKSFESAMSKSIADALSKSITDALTDKLFTGSDSLFGDLLKKTGLGGLFGSDSIGTSANPAHVKVVDGLVSSSGSGGTTTTISTSSSTGVASIPSTSAIAALFGSSSLSSSSDKSTTKSLSEMTALTGLKYKGVDLDQKDTALQKSAKKAMSELTESVDKNSSSLSKSTTVTDKAAEQTKKAKEATESSTDLLKATGGIVNLNAGYETWESGDELKGGIQMAGGAVSLYEGLGFGSTGVVGQTVVGVSSAVTAADSISKILDGEGTTTDYINAVVGGKVVYDMVKDTEVVKSVKDLFSSSKTTTETASTLSSTATGATALTSAEYASLNATTYGAEGFYSATSGAGSSAATSSVASVGATAAIVAIAAMVATEFLDSDNWDYYNSSILSTSKGRGMSQYLGDDVDGEEHNDVAREYRALMKQITESYWTQQKAAAAAGDKYATLITQMDGSTSSVETFVEAVTKKNVSLTQATDIAKLAVDAYNGVAGASGTLLKKLEALGLSEKSAGRAAEALVASMRKTTTAASSLNDTMNGLPGTFTQSASAAAKLKEALKNVSASNPGQGFGGSAAPAGATVTGANGMIIGLADGGLLHGGSHWHDDLYLGRINGTNYIAKGGEQVTNPYSSKKYAYELGLIQRDQFDLARFAQPAQQPSIMMQRDGRPIEIHVHVDLTAQIGDKEIKDELKTVAEDVFVEQTERNDDITVVMH